MRVEARPLCRAGLVALSLALAGATICSGQVSPSEPPRFSPQSADDAALSQVRGLMQSGHFHEAEILLRQQLQSRPGSAGAHAALGYCLLRQNEPAKALEEYTRAAAIRTPDAAELIQVGQAYVLLGDDADADRWTLRAVRMSPNDPDPWYSLGRIRYTEQRFADAAQCFRHVLALSPKNAKAENNLGLSEEGLNQTDDAIAAYRQAIAWQGDASSTGSEQPYLNLGIVLLHRNELDEAKALLTRAAALSPQDAHIYEQLGHVHLQQGDAARAAEAFGRAVQLDPNNSSLHFVLGQAYRRLGRQAEAKVQFDEALRLTRLTTEPKTK